MRNVNLVLVTDCGGSDEGRYGIAARRCFNPYVPSIAFFKADKFNTFHAGFMAAAHGLSTIEEFGPLGDDELWGILVNADPRHETEDGRSLRGDNTDSTGQDIYAVRLKNGAWAVGPNAGWNFYFLYRQIVESYLVTSEVKTAFRSKSVMIPALAKSLKIEGRGQGTIVFKEQDLVLPTLDIGVFVADTDDLGNVYLAASRMKSSWVPELGAKCQVRVGNKLVLVRCVDGIFAGDTGELTMTPGSLTQNGNPVYYFVELGGRAADRLGNPLPGTRVEITPV